MQLTRAAALAAAALGALLAGCTSTSNTDLAITDRGTFIPSGRASIDISPPGDPPSVPHTGHALEIAFSAASGNDTQSIAAGQPSIVFGGRTFGAPNELRHEFDFRFAELAYRYRNFFGQTRTFGIEALGGLGYADLDLTVVSPTQRASEKLSNAGLLGGFGLLWKFRPTTSLQSRFTVFLSGENEDVSVASRFDAYLAQAIGRNFGMRIGAAGWNIVSSRESGSVHISPNSRIRARFSGLAVELDVMF
jgi:hypothetical protein